MANAPRTDGVPGTGTQAQPALYLAILIIALIGSFAFRLRTQGIFACPAGGYTANDYLGYCNSGGYGEYDHGAFWFGLEPEAQHSASTADVLFLGNSRMQFGFSAPSTARWFESQGLKHYLMGFTFLENSTFAAPLLDRLKPAARVYVINVDQFFTRAETLPGGNLIDGRDTREHYREKQRWQSVHRPLCTAVPHLCGGTMAFYRHREDGHWLVQGHAVGTPGVVADAPASDRDQWQSDAEVARGFIGRLPVARSCIVLTIVPSQTTRRDEAQAIADAVGLPLIAPKLDGLRTFDDTHLDAASADRWSSAFLDAAGADIRQCTARAASDSSHAPS